MKNLLDFTVLSTEKALVQQRRLFTQAYMDARQERKRRQARIRAKRKISIQAHKG